MAVNHFLAIDLGAESGRAVAGIMENKQLFLEEVHRFPTGMIQLNGHFYWNIYRFYEEIVNAIRICENEDQIKPESVGIDTWGVDFGLLASDGTLCRIPYAYRDPQAVEGRDAFFAEKMAAESIYILTGIAMQPFNSLFHLYAMKKSGDFALENAKNLLFIPDILNYFLTGIKKSEFTFATTSQLYNPISKSWEKKLFNLLDIDMSIMSEIVEPGSIIGTMQPEVARQSGINPVPVVAVCSHDTGSAIVAVPAQGDDWAYISSGTWSLMGVENHRPVINARSAEYNFTNEGGAAGTYRFLKNIMGLWLLQQCRKSWSRSGRMISYGDLVDVGQTAGPFSTFIDPDYMGFYNPIDMPLAIDEYCLKTGQEPPQSIGEYVRTILEGLAFKYRYVLDQLNEISGKKIRKIHIIGGGTQNKLLCQFTSNVTGLPVIAGPAEGTAAGNILMQAYAMGYLKSLDEIREVVRNSFPLEIYEPRDVEDWEKAYGRFKEIMNKDIK
ncbi:MAG TPA: rhamnulokinase family protein [Bacteroidales bacterium]|nr:rhamnulokinase family protein [Bacteroidales bacterium]